MGKSVWKNDPGSSRARRRGIVASAASGAGGALLMAGSTSARAGALLPERGGSPNADRIAALYTVVLVLAALVFAAVVLALIYALWRYGERRNPTPSQSHGNTRLEIAWTAAATALILFLAVFSLTKLAAIDDPDPAAASPAAVAAGVAPSGRGTALHIRVVGRQYVWAYYYPGGTYSYGEMVAPVGVTVRLHIVSLDVAHSWWIPKLGGKFDAIPGYINHTWFRLERPGIYRGQCAELCGRNHANMLAQVRGVSPADYVAWLTQQKRSLLVAGEAIATAHATAPITTSP
jgi:cytochrome c oxidase subunit 2